MKKVDDGINSKYKDKFNWRKKMTKSIRDTKVSWTKKVNDDINSRYKGKLNWRKWMKISIRYAKISSAGERRQRHRFDIQSKVQLKKEDEDINSENRNKFTWRKKMNSKVVCNSCDRSNELTSTTTPTTRMSYMTALPSAERVSMSHCWLFTVTFCNRARRCRNTLKHLWWFDGVQWKCVYCVEHRQATKRKLCATLVIDRAR